MATAPNPPSVRNISQFKSAMRGGGARSNLFEVAIPEFPSFVGGGVYGNVDKATLRFMCKAANLPAANIAPIDVPFRGRILKVAGDRTFDPWTITVINDEDFRLRTAFEAWGNGISKLDNATGATNPGVYMKDGFVYQLGRGATISSVQPTGGISGKGPTESANVLRAYKFIDIFPTNVSEIALSYETGDTIEEFTVEFQVQYYEVLGAAEAVDLR
jgi:hypothetical protein